VARWRLHAFVALTLVSLLVGLGAGLEPAAAVRAYGEGMGGVLRGIAAVVGLGTILGKLLGESGGAEVLARTLARAFGERRLPWAMWIIGFVVGLPTWFTVGLVLLMPVLLAVQRTTGSPLLRLGLPMLGGLALAHALVPPHPGPMAAIGTLGVQVGSTDTGRVILFAVLVAIPAAILLHRPVAWLAARTPAEPGGAIADPAVATAPDGAAAAIASRRAPQFGVTLATVLLPLALMLLATGGAIVLPAGHAARSWLEFAGDPTVAMLGGVLVALWTLGRRCGFSATELARLAEECLGPVAAVLLVVGAGGGFSRVLAAGGIGEAVAGLARASGWSPLVLGWTLAAGIRVATGSSTVGITMAAGLVAPIAAAQAQTSPELLVIAMGAGSLFLSHVNDGGFWFVKEYFRLSAAQTLRTWSVLASALALAGLALVLAADWLRHLG
jgi:GntP family gluconate:H+ symporter